MHIAKIHVKNFRAVKDCAVKLDALTALVGPNGSGKSTFLHALALFQGKLNPTREDYYNRDVENDIEIKITFAGLPDEARKLFSKYLRGDELEVVRIVHWGDGKVSSKLHGYSLRNPDFVGVLGALNATVAKSQYNDVLLKNPAYKNLPTWTGFPNAKALLQKWEAANPGKCAHRPDDGKFFGYDGVGEGYLGRYIRILHVEAVRNAAGDGGDGKGSALGELLDLTVRKALAERGDLRALEEQFKGMLDGVMGGKNLPELDTLKADLNRTLGSLARGARVDLDWTVPEPSIGMPRASARLVEDRYSSPVGGAGHGLQRAFIMTVLHNLSKAQAGDGQKGGEQAGGPAEVPSFVLAIDEPELYQHPTRMRHLARRLRDLSDNGIPGVAGRMQVVYTTHSPHFVFADRIGQVRLVSKRGSAGGSGGIDDGKPGATAVSSTTPAGILQEMKRCGAVAESATSVDHFLLRAMGPAASEGFFADAVVLVEGPSDRIMLEAAAEAMGCPLDALGAAVIPCGSKSAIPLPIAMFRSLGIPVYAVWDADENDDSQKRESEHIASALGYEGGDWHGRITGMFACLPADLEDTVRSDLEAALGPEWGDRPDRTILAKRRARHGVRKKDSKTLNAQLIAEEVREAPLHLKTLESIVQGIANMAAGPAPAPAAPRHALYKSGTIPPTDDMMYPVLEMCSGGKARTFGELVGEMSEWLGLSAEQRRERTRGGGGEAKVRATMRWAVWHLRKAGLLGAHRLGKMRYKATDSGEKIVADASITRLPISYLKEISPVHRKWKEAGSNA